MVLQDCIQAESDRLMRLKIEKIKLYIEQARFKYNDLTPNIINHRCFTSSIIDPVDLRVAMDEYEEELRQGKRTDLVGRRKNTPDDVCVDELMDSF